MNGEQERQVVARLVESAYQEIVDWIDREVGPIPPESPDEAPEITTLRAARVEAAQKAATTGRHDDDAQTPELLTLVRDLLQEVVNRTKPMTEARQKVSRQQGQRARELRDSGPDWTIAAITARLTRERDEGDKESGHPHRKPIRERTVEKYLAKNRIPSARRAVGPDDDRPDCQG